MERTARWVPRVKELLNTFLHQTEGNSGTNYLYSQSVRNVLNNYNNRFATDPVNLVDSMQPKSRIFANNYLNLGDVKVVGYDLDFTLVTYTIELQTLIYNLARDILVSAYGFPKELKSCEFDAQFAIRGLSVDVRNGVLMKLNHLQRVGSRYAYLGKRLVTADEMESFYGPSRHMPYNELKQLRPLNDMFSIAEACLIADAMETFEHNKNRRGELYSTPAIIDDIQAAIREVHVSGQMHNAVIADLDRFVHHNPLLPDLLQHIKAGGKKLFLCTNSNFHYTNKALQYAIGDQRDWRQLFDVVICSAQKPDFFNSKKPFRRWDAENNRPSTSPVGDLRKGEVYVGGSVQALERATGWRGKDVLFIGDNLRVDLTEARRWHGWKTACVINELDREIEIQNMSWFHEVHFLRSNLRRLIGDLQMCMNPPFEACDENTIDMNACGIKKAFREEDDEMLQVFETELQRVNVELSSLFNQQFGSIFRTDGHPSLFAFAVRRYADLYLSEVCHMLHYNPQHRFYPQHALHMVRKIYSYYFHSCSC